MIAYASVFLAILMPPEAYPAGRMAIILSSTFVFLIALIEGRLPYKYAVSGITIFALLFLHSLCLSVDLNRSLEFLTVLWAYYCLLGFFIWAGGDSPHIFAGVVVILSMIVSGYGLYQYFWGFDQLFNYIFYSASDQVIKVPAMETLSSRRVFSTLALPGTLWGFLLVALPIHCVLWKQNRLLDVFLLVSAGLLLTTGFLTRSFGFIAGLFLLVTAQLIMQHRKVLWNKASILLGTLLVLAMIGGVFYSMRREVIEEANPASLRAKNWLSAWNIFALHPLGTGLNTFGVVYPQFMQPNANETQFAHNTLLQLMSELGYPALLALMAAVIMLARRRWPEGTASSPYLTLALIVWLAHNLIDINVYFPSMGVLGMVLIGILLARPRAEAIVPPQLILISVSLVAVVVMIFSGLVLVASELRHQARIESENSQIVAALASLDLAKKFNPLNSSLYHESGEICLDLYYKKKDPQYLELATAAFGKAVELSPNTVGPHVGLGLSLSTANKVEEALREIDTAQRLYPESSYIRSIARLMGKRIEN
jgi:hypothetical protein